MTPLQPPPPPPQILIHVVWEFSHYYSIHDPSVSVGLNIVPSNQMTGTDTKPVKETLWLFFLTILLIQSWNNIPMNTFL